MKPKTIKQLFFRQMNRGNISEQMIGSMLFNPGYRIVSGMTKSRQSHGNRSKIAANVRKKKKNILSKKKFFESGRDVHVPRRETGKKIIRGFCGF